jgi:hypothetical protein
MEQKPIKSIEKLYNNLTYYDIYSTSLILFVLFTLFIIILYSYFYVMTNSNEIKKNWNLERCKPHNILFAGLINKPKDKSMFDYTTENFEYCNQNITTSIVGYALQPFYYLYNQIISVLSNINEDINMIRQLITSIRSSIQEKVKEIMERLLNFTIPIQQLMITVYDIFGKFQAILTSCLMTALGAYYTLQSLIGSIIEFIIILLISLSIMILALWLGIFTWPFAVAMTAVFISVSIPLVIIVVFMTLMLKIHTKSVPKIPKGHKPKCFDENTEFILLNGETKKIKDLQLYDVLINKSIITTTIILDTKNETMYSLNNIIVSGEHPVLYNNKWILIKEHPRSKIIKNYDKPYIYCVNTNNKLIELNHTIFSDWDEVYSNLNNIKDFISKIKKNNNFYTFNSFNDIHLYLDKGFQEEQQVELFDGSSKKIMDIQINDKLINGEVVYGIVKLKNIFCLEEKINYLYSLLTDKGTFKINNEIIDDYNSCISL